MLSANSSNLQSHKTIEKKREEFLIEIRKKEREKFFRSKRKFKLGGFDLSQPHQYVPQLL